MLDWHIAVTLSIGFSVFVWIMVKLIANKLPRSHAISLQFLICAILISLFNLAAGNFHFSKEAIVVIPIGVFVAFGNYCQWRAIEVSLNRTSIFSPLGDVLTVVLAGIFLSEFAEWNYGLAAGTILCFLAIFLFLKGRNARKENQNGNNVKKWLLFMLGAIIIFGTATFLMKVFSANIPCARFLMYWYVGTFIGSLFLFYFEKQNPFRFPGKLIFVVPLISLGIMGNLAMVYWGFELAPASKVVPFRLVGVTFLPVLIGWFLFKEREGLSKNEMLAFLISVAGALLIILS